VFLRRSDPKRLHEEDARDGGGKEHEEGHAVDVSNARSPDVTSMNPETYSCTRRLARGPSNTLECLGIPAAILVTVACARPRRGSRRNSTMPTSTAWFRTLVRVERLVVGVDVVVQGTRRTLPGDARPLVAWLPRREERRDSSR